MNFSESAYESLLEEIAKAHPTVQTSGFGADAFKPGLEGMIHFDSSQHHPSRQFKSIHVAGTNGKGSVCSMLAASLASSGLRVGLYTSPHLVDFRERIKIIDIYGDERVQTGVSWQESPESSAVEIPKAEVYSFLTENNLAGLSYFEITTGMAFWWFAKRKVDVAVIEVGLGGRYDSTNIITPELSIITSIGLDHCAILGNTRAEIAYEKAGIFKPGIPALVWGRDDETSSIFEQYAARIGCPLHFADEEELGIGKEEFEKMLSCLDLQGPCQRDNLRTVLASLNLLNQIPHFRSRDKLSNERHAQNTGVLHTAKITAFRGRWERLQNNPEVICDIGHNPPALKNNFKRLAETNRPLFIVYGVMADKDLDGIAALMPEASRYFLVAPDTSRSLPSDELGARLAALRPDLYLTVAPSVEEGVRGAIALASRLPDALVYIGGSTFVVAEAISTVYSSDK